MYLSSTFG